MNHSTTPRKVSVDKDRLLETLRANKAEHRSIFERAQRGYRTKVIEVLDARLESARSGGPINTYIGLTEPKDFTAEYDAVIAELEWSGKSESVIDLDQREFRQLVLNQWDWMDQFSATNSVYLSD